jgi:hypothetical protein
MDWLFADTPTKVSPDSLRATTDGVERSPLSLGSTAGKSPSIHAARVLVVPKSMPIIPGISAFFPASRRVPSRGYGQIYLGYRGFEFGGYDVTGKTSFVQSRHAFRKRFFENKRLFRKSDEWN